MAQSVGTKHTHTAVLLRWLPGRRFLLQRLSSNLLFRTFTQTHFPFITVYICCWATKVLSDGFYSPSAPFFQVILPFFHAISWNSISQPSHYISVSQIFFWNTKERFSAIGKTTSPLRVTVGKFACRQVVWMLFMVPFVWLTCQHETQTEPRESIWERTLRKILEGDGWTFYHIQSWPIKFLHYQRSQLLTV